MNRDELRANVDTIVLIMMENRSFDHMLGHLSLPEYGGRTDIDGLRDLANADFGNASQNGTMYHPFKADDEQLSNDLPHERAFVTTQLARSAALGGFAMNGFVQAYEAFTGTTGVLNPPPMRVMTPEDVPVTGFLAREFLVCDRWFAPLPTSTQPNRLMAFGGDSLLDVSRNGLLPDQDLIFDWLTRHEVNWRVYGAGLSFFTLMKKVWPLLLSDRFRSLPHLSFDMQHEDDATFPEVIFVEPDYDDSPIHSSGHASDNHPPLPVGFGEQFLKQVYEALTSNPDRWRKMVGVLTYDENGGFFDHVAPRSVKYPPPAGAQFAAFESTGVRVPAVVFSPFVARGGASRLVLDHTSFLQMVAERFAKRGETYSPSVAARAAAGITSLSAVLSAQAPRADIPEPPENISVSELTLVTTRAPSNSMQSSFATAIEGFTDAHGKEAMAKYPEIAHYHATK